MKEYFEPKCTKKIKKIKNYNIILIIALVIFFEPQMFKEENFKILMYVDKLYKIAKLIVSALVIYIYIYNSKISKIVISMIIFQIIAFASTIINHGSITRFAGPAITTVTMIMIAEIIINNKELFNISKKMNIYFRICFIINVLSVILVDGFKIYEDELYFLGIDNRWIFSYLPWMFFELIYAQKSENYRNAYVSFGLIELSLLYKWSVSAFLLNLIWLVPLIAKNKIHFTKIAVPTFVFTLLSNILIVFCKIQNIFSKLLSNLKKDITLSGRTLLWDNVLKNAKNKPILGNGMQTLIYDKDFFGSSANNELDCLKVGHAHNSYMTILYRYGILGLMSYLATILMVIFKLRENYTNKYANIIFFAIIIVLLLSIFDTIDCSGLYFILACGYSIKYIERE